MTSGNAIVMKRQDGDSDLLIVWFDREELHILAVEKETGIRWVFGPKESEWFCESLAQLQERGIRRAQGGE